MHYLRQAGLKAAARSALQDAQAWFEQALGELERRGVHAARVEGRPAEASDLSDTQVQRLGRLAIRNPSDADRFQQPGRCSSFRLKIKVSMTGRRFHRAVTP